MNNLKYYNDALAYDFEMFMPKVKPQDNIIKMPEKQKVRKAKKKTAAARISDSAFAIAATVILVGALCANIVLRIQVNELNNNINAAQTVLNEKKSESVALQMEYENRISYINLEAEATALGMRKLDKEQVVYIRVNDKSKARTLSGEIVSSEN